VNASHWLRESPDHAELRHINAVGIEMYRARRAAVAAVVTVPDHRRSNGGSSDQPRKATQSVSAPLDPRLVAAHMKHVCQQFPNGIIIDPVRDALMELVPTSITGASTQQEDDWCPDRHQLEKIRWLLRTRPLRYRCLSRIMQLVDHILTAQQTDRITLSGLAVLLPITSGTEVTDIATLKRWHTCLAVLMNHRETVFSPKSPDDIACSDGAANMASASTFDGWRWLASCLLTR
jgi:hypothetical protein